MCVAFFVGCVYVGVTGQRKIKTMNLYEIIRNHHWLSVCEILFKLDPELQQFELEYEQVFKSLIELKPIISNIILMIDRHWEEGKPTEHAHAYGYDPSVSDSEPTPYLALEWTNWEKWLGFEIDRNAIEEWTELQLIGHSMIELTLDGFTQEEVWQTSNNLVSQINTIKSK